MNTIDWPTLINWIISGVISLSFGIVGGFIGSWIKYSFESKREKERERKELGAKLLVGVNDFVEKTRRLELGEIDIGKFTKSMIPTGGQTKVRIGSLIVIIFVVYSFLFLAIYPPLGRLLLLLLGLFFGIRVKY